MFSGKPQELCRKNLLMNNRQNDSFNGDYLVNLVDKYYGLYIPRAWDKPEDSTKPPLGQLIFNWLSIICFADPGVLVTLLENWSHSESQNDEKYGSSGFYVAAMKHPPCIMSVLVEKQIINQHRMEDGSSLYAESNIFFGAIYQY